MAYLGQVLYVRPFRELIWTVTTFPEELIGEIIGQYATYGGFIYVG